MRVFAIAFLLIASALSAAEAGDGTLVWKTIDTEHFVIHYHEPLGDVARHVAAASERAHAVLAPALDHEPEERTAIVLSDDTDGSNGFASVIPRNTIRLFATAPSSVSALSDYDDWLYDLILHEYVHILHLDSITGLPYLYNLAFGKTWAPNQIQPRWAIEGLATYEESKQTSAGRTRFALFDMNLRIATLSGDFRRLDEISTGPRDWPHGNAAYIYGSYFLKYVFDRYGDDKVSDWSWAYAANPVPYGLNKAIYRATGKTFVELYEEWRRYRIARYKLQVEAVERAGRREGRRVTFTSEVNFDPRYSRDGRVLIWSYGDGYTDGRYAYIPVGGNQGQQGTYAVLDRSASFAMLRDGRMVIEQTDIYRTNYSFQEIILYDPKTKEHVQLTRGLRARDPAVAPDEREIAFAVNGQSRRVLAVMPLRPGAEPRIVWEGDHRYDQALTPAYSRDGKLLAFSAWRQGGTRDILILDRETGEVRELSHNRSQDIQPVFDPGGEYLYYASDRTGIYNIYAYELATGRLFQVTNVIAAALAPDVSPDGKRIAYQGYERDGWEIYEILVDRAAWTEAPLYVSDRPDPVEIDADTGVATGPRPYSPLESLAPRAYTAQLVANNFGRALNLQTGGSDHVGLHSYNLGATISLTEGHVGLGLNYGYQRRWAGVGLALARSVARRGGYRIGDVSTAYTEERLAGTLSLGLPVLRTPNATGTLSADYNVDYTRNVEDLFRMHDPNERVPGYPETDFIAAGASLRFNYSDSEGFVYSVGPRIGHQLSLSARLNHPAVGSDVESLNLRYQWNWYTPLPLSPTSTFAFRVAGGWRATVREEVGDFGLGSVPEQNLIDSLLNNLRAGVTGYLRGYPPRVVNGNQFHVANLELRQLVVDVERGYATVPFYVRRLHVAGLFDVGDATNDSLDLGRFRTSVGAALRTDMVIGYFIPGSFDIGYARGLNEGGVNEFWLLLTGTI